MKIIFEFILRMHQKHMICCFDRAIRFRCVFNEKFLFSSQFSLFNALFSDEFLRFQELLRLKIISILNRMEK